MSESQGPEHDSEQSPSPLLLNKQVTSKTEPQPAKVPPSKDESTPEALVSSGQTPAGYTEQNAETTPSDSIIAEESGPSPSPNPEPNPASSEPDTTLAPSEVFAGTEPRQESSPDGDHEPSGPESDPAHTEAAPAEDSSPESEQADARPDAATELSSGLSSTPEAQAASDVDSQTSEDEYATADDQNDSGADADDSDAGESGEGESDGGESGADDSDPDSDPEPEEELLAQSFEELGLPEPALSAVKAMGWTKPSPVQAKSYAPFKAGHDLLVQSHTGSGKTGAFCLPWIAERFIPGPAKDTRVQFLAVVPTRELARQVSQEMQRLAQGQELRIEAIYGGAAIVPQLEALKAGVHAVVGTPGRLLDHLRRRSLDLRQVKTVILDECDEMLSMGFLEDIRAILDHCAKERQTGLFSATLPPDIQRIARRYLEDPVRIELSGDQIAAREIDHVYYNIGNGVKTRDLLDILLLEDPSNAIVFCNTREETRMVASVLQREGYSAQALSSDLTQGAREAVLRSMRDRQLRFLVATDIAARGIDISHITHVINYSFPNAAESYVHRTGRTGRAGRAGVAISLISALEIGDFYLLKKQYSDLDIRERHMPSPEELKAQRREAKLDKLSHDFSKPVSAEWIALARYLQEDPRGERVVAYLLSEAIKEKTRRQRHQQLELERDEGGEDTASPSEALEAGAGADASSRGRRERDYGRSGARGEGRRSRSPRRDRDRDRDREGGSSSRRSEGRAEARSRYDAKSESRSPRDEAQAGAGADPELSATADAQSENRLEEGYAKSVRPCDDDGPRRSSERDDSGRVSRRERVARARREGSGREGSGREGRGRRRGEGRRDRNRRGRESSEELHSQRRLDALEEGAKSDDSEGLDKDSTLAQTTGLDEARSEGRDESSERDWDGQNESEGGRRRKRRRRRRPKDSSEGESQLATESDDEELAGDGHSDSQSEEEQSSASRRDASGQTSGQASGQRRRRKRRRDRFESSSSSGFQEESRVSQEEIVLDIDEEELEVVRGEFGEINELDDLTVKGRRRDFLDELSQGDEVELEDLSSRDAEREVPQSEEGAEDPAEEGSEEGSEEDFEGDAATDEDDEQAKTADGEDKLTDPADDSEGSKDALEDGDEGSNKRRRRRRRKKKSDRPPLPELTAPPHKDFWEVWSDKFKTQDFQNLAEKDEEDLRLEAEARQLKAQKREEERRERAAARAEQRKQRREKSEVSALETKFDSGDFIKVSLNIGRDQGCKSATIRRLLQDECGITRSALKDLTVRQSSTLFQLRQEDWEEVAETLSQKQVEGVDLLLQRVAESPESEDSLRVESPEPASPPATSDAEHSASATGQTGLETGPQTGPQTGLDDMDDTDIELEAEPEDAESVSPPLEADLESDPDAEEADDPEIEAEAPALPELSIQEAMEVAIEEAIEAAAAHEHEDDDDEEEDEPEEALDEEEVELAATATKKRSRKRSSKKKTTVKKRTTRKKKSSKKTTKKRSTKKASKKKSSKKTTKKRSTKKSGTKKRSTKKRTTKKRSKKTGA